MFPTGESFSESQTKVLERFVTNTETNVFCLKNLPEVIKGALFSRYSRSSLGLRALLLKEFVGNEEETAFQQITQSQGKEEVQEQSLAIQKAQNFYDRILDGYGDDSIGELGGAHLAIENVSMIGAKLIEDCRIGGSPLEKSTRYIYFDQQVEGAYRYYREPILMTSAFRELYESTCDMLFETYGKMIPPLTAILEERFPRTDDQSKVAYTASLRAKVLDCLRGILPAGTLTNMGVFGNGRFFEQLLHKLHSHNLAEMQQVGKDAHTELTKVIPSFVRRSDPSHKHHQAYINHFETLQDELSLLAKRHEEGIPLQGDAGVRLIANDPDPEQKVAAALLYPFTSRSLEDLSAHCETLSEEDIAKILDAGCGNRENRRHKSPRALEHVNFTFEFLSDYGVYRDLQRHRTLTQEHQHLTCDFGYFIPSEIMGTEMEEDYIRAMTEAKRAFDSIAKELPEEAQYVVPMAYQIRWYFHINLRALVWLCELRSGAAGHPTYRKLAQDMARQVMDKVPAFERFFRFVDFEGHDLGRMNQEVRKEKKREQMSVYTDTNK